MGCALLVAASLQTGTVAIASVVHRAACPVVAPADDSALETARREALDLLDNRTAEGSLPGEYTKEARETFRAAVEQATTVAEITSATKTYQDSVVGVLLSDSNHEYWYYITSGPSMSYCQNAIIYDMSVKAGEQLKWNDRASEARGMWKFVVANKVKGTVRIVNKATGFSVLTSGGNGSKVTSAGSVTAGTAFNLNSLGEQRAFLIREGTKQPVHADKSGVVVAWRTTNLGSASVWHFDPVDNADLEAGEGTTDYELVWADEFNVDGKLDEANWSYEQGFVRNSEPQWYQADNAICQDGTLVITARKAQVKNPNYQPGSNDWKTNREYAAYTSSSVITYGKRDLKYGRIEVRAKIPTTSGAWPAIWCKGYPATNGPWPACGEVDILEFYDKSIFANLCWSNATGDSQWRTVKTPFTHFTNQDPDWTSKYHVWRMDWDSLSARLYLDDELLNVTSLERTVQPVGDFCKTENPFKTPLFLLLNLALRTPDGIDESVLPIKYYIDYVRFYQIKKSATGIDAVKSPATEAWIVNTADGYYVDMRSFSDKVSVNVADAAGRTISSTRIPASYSTYRLPALPHGIYIVTATDGQTRRSEKLTF